jgi:lysozyme family protein
MTPVVDQVIADLLEDEGGVKDVGDGKGITRWGQTPGWLQDHGFVPPTSAADAAVNYGRWMKQTRLAELCGRDAYIGWVVTDFAVLSGVVTAVTALQRACNVAADGALGPVTLAAVTPERSARIARRLLQIKVETFGALVSSKKVDRREWARGWFNRIGRQIVRLP